MGIFAGATFLMSHEHSKTKYNNYGKNERTMDEDERGGDVQNRSSNTTRTYTDRHTMSKLHEEKLHYYTTTDIKCDSGCGHEFVLVNANTVRFK